MAAKRQQASKAKIVRDSNGQIVQPTRSYARAGRVETETRINHVCEMMRNLTYRTGDTARELAVTWGLSLDRTQAITLEAHNRITAEVLDPVNVRRNMGSALNKIMVDATTSNKAEDKRLLIQAAKVLGILTGSNAPTRIVVREEPLEKMSDERLEELAREALKSLSGKDSA